MRVLLNTLAGSRSLQCKMVVCRYYQQGNCRYGDNCRNEHPGAQSNRNTSFASQNRFSAFQGPTVRTGSDVRKDAQWNFSIADVKADLTAGKGRPEWILSTYGPGKNAPASLLDGNELSFEELRVRYYELRAEGKEMQAVNEASALWSKAEQQIADVLNNVDKVVPYMEESQKKHPNRYDLLGMTGTISRDQVVREAGQSSPFGGNVPQASSFGAPSSGFGSRFGTTSASGFGSEAPKVGTTSMGAFGQTTPSSSFGAPSIGLPPKPAFGQPSFGQPLTNSAFGKPGGGTFGQPSTLGQTSGFGNLGFGQTAVKNPFAAPSAVSFGQPSKPASAFGQTLQPTSGLGQPSQPSSGFGQPSQLGGGFGQPSKPVSGFGQLSQPSSGFGQPPNPFSRFGHESQPAAAFGQPSQIAPAFGQPSQPASAFGPPAQGNTTFGQPSQPTPAFGQPLQSSSTFGQPAQSSTANQAVPTFGQPLSSQPTDRKPSNPFGSASNASNTAFSQPSQPTAERSNPFSTAPSSSPSTLINTPTPPPPSTTTLTTSIPTRNSHPLTSKPPAPIHYTQTLPSTGRTQFDPRHKRLVTYKSRPVKYIHDSPCYERPDGKGWERIWFPDGGPENVRLDDVQPSQEKITDEVRNAYQSLAETGRFEMGKLPVVAPLTEWVSFDF